MTTSVSLMDDQMADMTFATQLNGLTNKWLYRLIKDRASPTPIKLGHGSRWSKSEMEAQLQARIAQPRPQLLIVICSSTVDVIPGLPTASYCLLYPP